MSCRFFKLIFVPELIVGRDLRPRSHLLDRYINDFEISVGQILLLWTSYSAAVCILVLEVAVSGGLVVAPQLTDGDIRA